MEGYFFGLFFYLGFCCLWLLGFCGFLASVAFGFLASWLLAFLASVAFGFLASVASWLLWLLGFCGFWLLGFLASVASWLLWLLASVVFACLRFVSFFLIYCFCSSMMSLKTISMHFIWQHDFCKRSLHAFFVERNPFWCPKKQRKKGPSESKQIRHE